MFTISRSYAALCVAALLMVGCSTAPTTEEKRVAQAQDVQNALTQMKQADPDLDAFIKKAYGYAVFPSVGKGGLIVGGAYGKGEVYEGGKMIGWADLSVANIGLQAGGQSFSELICFENKAALDNFRNGKLKFSADASAVALKSGASAAAKYTDGVAVFTKPEGGLMFEASIGGQSFSFLPK